jgi:hypothetical protein
MAPCRSTRSIHWPADRSGSANSDAADGRTRAADGSDVLARWPLCRVCVRQLGNFDIWVVPIAGGDPVQITNSPAAEMQPDWSPDGSAIVFHSERDGGGIYIVPALGGAQRRLTSSGMYPKWSRDGAEIFFVAGSMLETGGGTPAAAFSVPVEGGALRQIRADFLDRGSWYWVATHPDGRVSALGTHETRGFGFYTLNRAGGAPVASKMLPELPIRWVANEPAVSRFQWNATGTELYLEGRAGGVQNLWRIRVNPATLEWVSGERLTTGPGSDTAADRFR